jgi:epoxide hydrolase 4
MSTTDLYLHGSEGIRLHGVAAGEGGRVMLFLHGFPEFWRAWHRQLPEFGRDHRAVAVDLRGYNLSDKPEGVAHYALPKIVDDVRQVLGALSPGARAILVGHDWGGIVGWTLARESPELIERLIIINAPHPLIFHRELKQNPMQQLASSYAGFFQLQGVAEAALRAFDFAALRKMVFGTSAKPGVFPPELRAAYREAWKQPYALTAGLNYYRNLRALRHVITSAPDWIINVPTLVLWGEQDPSLRKTNLVGLERFVPRLSIQRHPSATHWIVHEEPEWVHAAIRGFVVP